MHFKEKFEWFLKNSMEEENTDKPSLSWKKQEIPKRPRVEFPHMLHEIVLQVACVCSHSVVFNSLQPHGL